MNLQELVESHLDLINELIQVEYCLIKKACERYLEDFNLIASNPEIPLNFINNKMNGAKISADIYEKINISNNKIIVLSSMKIELINASDLFKDPK